MTVAIITANLGKFDPVVEYVPQTFRYPIDIYRVTDENFPPRYNSMTPRLQARIPKMFGWEMFPGYDYYIWVDASCALLHPHSVAWFFNQCRDYDCAFFLHPDRKTIREEQQFLDQKIIVEKNRYLSTRYAGELIAEQMQAINADPDFVDHILYASTAFIYQNNEHTRSMLKEWWFHVSRYHSIDQLSLPYVLWQSDCAVKKIQENYLKIPYLTYTRNRKAA